MRIKCRLSRLISASQILHLCFSRAIHHCFEMLLSHKSHFCVVRNQKNWLLFDYTNTFTTFWTKLWCAVLINIFTYIAFFYSRSLLNCEWQVPRFCSFQPIWFSFFWLIHSKKFASVLQLSWTAVTFPRLSYQCLGQLRKLFWVLFSFQSSHFYF